MARKRKIKRQKIIKLRYKRKRKNKRINQYGAAPDFLRWLGVY